MKYKTKNNILIILIVTLSALTVIILVLITGFSKSGHNSGDSGISAPNAISGDMSDTSGQSGDELSGQTSDPVESSAVESADNSSDSSAPPNDDIGQRIVVSASALIGVPFAENGSSPSGFDNSGFIYYVLRENGYITCPRTTEAQSSMGMRVGRDSLKPGDLVFFENEGSGEADFGGIYIGSGKMIACLKPGTNVSEVDIMTDYYVSNFFGGVSLS